MSDFADLDDLGALRPTDEVAAVRSGATGRARPAPAPPAPNADDVGRVSSVGSNREPFWDDPQDVVERAVAGPIETSAGAAIVVNPAGDGYRYRGLPDLPALPPRQATPQDLDLHLPGTDETDAHRRLTGWSGPFDDFPSLGAFELGGKGYGFKPPRQVGSDWLAALHPFDLATGVVGAKIADVDVGGDGGFPRAAMVDGSNVYIMLRHTDGEHYLHTLDVSDGTVARRAGGTAINGSGSNYIVNCGAVLAGTGYFMQVNALANYRMTVYSVNLTTGVAAAIGGQQRFPWGDEPKFLPGGLVVKGANIEAAVEQTGHLTFQRLDRAAGTFTKVAEILDHAVIVRSYFGGGYLVSYFAPDGVRGLRLTRAVDAPIPSSWTSASGRRVTFIPDDAALPPLADYGERDVILWRGELYHKGVTESALSFSFRAGALSTQGGTSRGWEIGAFGQAIVNPAANFLGMFDDGTQLELFVRRSAYRAAKGSNEGAGDQIAAAVATDEDTPRNAAITLTYGGSGVGGGDDTYLQFRAARHAIFQTAAVEGHNVTVVLTRGGAAFMQVGSGATHEAWVPVELAQAQRNAAATRGLIRLLGADAATGEAAYDALSAPDPGTLYLWGDAST